MCPLRTMTTLAHTLSVGLLRRKYFVLGRLAQNRDLQCMGTAAAARERVKKSPVVGMTKSSRRQAPVILRASMSELRASKERSRTV